MEWRKATKYIIILLIAVNAVLFCLNLYKANATVVSSGRIADITALLKTRSVTLDCSIPNKYRPMAQLYTENTDFDYIKLQNLFMLGMPDIKRTERYNSVVFSSANTSLVIKGGNIVYTGTSESAFTTSDAASVYAENMADKINELFGDYEFHSAASNNGEYIIKYYSKYEGKNVFSNFLYFTIKGNNINITLNYSKLNGSGRSKGKIIGSDEAIFAALDRIKEDHPDKCSISSVELGYYDSELSPSEEEYAVPCYAVRVGNREYFVNAYNGEVF